MTLRLCVVRGGLKRPGCGASGESRKVGVVLFGDRSGPRASFVASSTTLRVLTLALVLTISATLIAPATCSPPLRGATKAPSLAGLRGQVYQIPALPDYVYNLITYQPLEVTPKVMTDHFALSPVVVINGRFTHLGSADCTGTCLADTDTYMSATYMGSTLTLNAGPHRHGFSSWTNTGVDMGMVLDTASRARIQVGPFEIAVENSDRFINVLSVLVVGSQTESEVLKHTTGLLVNRAQTVAPVGKGIHG